MVESQNVLEACPPGDTPETSPNLFFGPPLLAEKVIGASVLTSEAQGVCVCPVLSSSGRGRSASSVAADVCESMLNLCMLNQYHVRRNKFGTEAEYLM